MPTSNRPFQKIWIETHLQFQNYEGDLKVTTIENIIRRISNNNRTLKQLVDKHGMSVVRESVKEMLINRFYHDDGRERVRKAFPSLFHKGQMRVDNLGDEDEEEDAPFDEEAYERDYEKLAAALGTDENRIFLTIKNQTIVLRAVEAIMEKFVFRFFKRWMPQELKNRLLESPHVISLEHWVILWGIYLNSFPREAFPPNVTSSQEVQEWVLEPLNSVHRLANTSEILLDHTQILDGIQKLTHAVGVLQDTQIQAELQALEAKLTAVLEKIWNSRRGHREEYKATLKRIDEARAQQDRNEKIAARTVYEKDQCAENTHMRSFTAPPSGPSSAKKNHRGGR